MNSLSAAVKRNEFQKLVRYRRSLFDDPDLRQLAIELTMDCNCRCRHCGSDCYAGAGSKDTVSDETILRALRGLKTDLKREKRKPPFVFVTGGEPLLREGVLSLMKSVYDMGYNWGMTTNGTLIGEETAASLKDAGMASVSISIDGTKDIHDWFRQLPGSYDKAVNAVRHLVSAGIKNVMVTTVVHRSNIDGLEDLYSIVRDTGCHIWRVVNMEPIGRALDNPGLMLRGDDYRRLLDFIKTHNRKDFPVNFGCNHFLGYELEHEVRPWYFFCQSGIKIMSIRADGSITGCLDIKRDPSAVFGNINNDRLFDVWRNGFGIYRRIKAADSPKCRDCRYLGECDGGGYHTWNSADNRPMICMMEELGHNCLAKTEKTR